MTRVDDDTLSLHLEMALSTTAPSLLDGLTDTDRRRRHAVVGEIARTLVEQLRCFDIFSEDADRKSRYRQPTLFPGDLGPMDLTLRLAAMHKLDN
jgi:hypothetical protein